MIPHDGLIRIFWPLELVKPDKSGVLVGWRNSSTDILVASILQDAFVSWFSQATSTPETYSSIQPRSVDNALRVGTLFRGAPYPIEHLLRRCAPAKLEILGTVNSSDSLVSPNSMYISARTNPSSRFPQIASPILNQFNVQIILYARPHPVGMQFMSLDPINLSLQDSDRIGLEVPPFKGIDAVEKAEERKQAELVKKLRLHTVKRYPSTEKELAIPTIMNQINCSFDINATLQRNIWLVRPRTRRALSVSERVVESALNLWDYILIALGYAWTQWIWPVGTQLFILLLMAHRIAGEAILLLARQPLGPHQIALKDISATAQQVDLRLQQFCYWPVQFMTLKERKQTWPSIADNHSEYIRFYNSLWLVANDVIMGIAIGAYILDNVHPVAVQSEAILTTLSLEGLAQFLDWLKDEPAGFKLNKELARFLAELFIAVIGYWSGKSSRPTSIVSISREKRLEMPTYNSRPASLPSPVSFIPLPWQ